MKTNIIIVAIILIVGSGAFYGGMKYQSSKTPSRGFGNLTQEQRQAMMKNGGARIGGNNASGSAVVNGEIISRDDKSVTIKLRDGGSKIILYSASTEIGKMATGTPDDLGINQNVMATGTTNDDGSITAKTIQLRPGEAGQPAPVN